MGASCIDDEVRVVKNSGDGSYNPDNLAEKNGLTDYQKQTLRNMLKTDQAEIDYNNASSDSLYNLVGWYYNNLFIL